MFGRLWLRFLSGTQIFPLSHALKFIKFTCHVTFHYCELKIRHLYSLVKPFLVSESARKRSTYREFRRELARLRGSRHVASSISFAALISGPRRNS